MQLSYDVIDMTRFWRNTVVVALLAASLTGCKGIPELDSQWAAMEIQVDGAFSDWSEIPTTYFEEEQIVFGLANDSANLYLLFRFRDPMWIRSMTANGLTIWLDANGKNDKRFMLRYKGGPSPEEMMQFAGQGRGLPEGTDEKSGRFRGPDRGPGRNEFVCYIKDVIVEKEIDPEGSQGPSAAYGRDQDSFVYEFSVPLGESRVRDYGLGTTPGRPLGIGLKWGGGERGRRFAGRDDGFGSGAEFGPPGGQPPGRGEGRTPSGGRPQLPQETKVWLKSKLAVAVTGDSAASD